MTVCSTNNLLQDTSCDRSLDDHVQTISELLPTGPAWPRDPDSTLMRYWTVFADIVKYAEDRICALVDEFYCATATETLDVWVETYLGEIAVTPDVDPACLKDPTASVTDLNALVCAKMIEQGGSECNYFTDYATALGWSATCEDVSDTQMVMAGCFSAGCAALPPKAPYVSTAGTLGAAPLQSRYEGRAADHWFPEYFDSASAQSKVPCGMIGSNLGLGPLGPDCCSYAGYYTYPEESRSTTTNHCSGQSGIQVRSHNPGFASEPLVHCDTSGKFEAPFGFAHIWRLNVDVPASLQIQHDNSNLTDLYAPVGCMHCGNACTPLRGANLQSLVDAIEEVKPAHTVLNINATWT